MAEVQVSSSPPFSDQPDFGLLRDGLETTVTQLSRLGNIPALDQGASLHDRINTVLTRLDEMQSNINQRFDEVDGRFNKVDERFNEVDGRIGDLNEKVDGVSLRLAANDYNNVARFTNSNRGRIRDSSLVPLRNAKNEEVAGFPATGAQLTRLNGTQLNNLLAAYDLGISGSVPERRRRLTEYIGIVVTAP